MSIQEEYVIRLQDGLWQVWLGDRLVSGHPTQMEAQAVVDVLAHSAAARGERAKVLVGAPNGAPLDFPTIEPQAQPE